MKKICLTALVSFMIFALVSGFIGETYASNHKDCACCTSNKCHSNAKCHNTAKPCVCSYQATQVFLPKSNFTPALIFTGYIAQNLDFTYLYLYTEDIFHPPKA
ncbi:MAG: hypothetical protein PHS93_02800 [Candidatus Omnitrophica bacterium]|nr:hypothetical protein [Candidatus Omnitrophota bacterium]MDD5352079.1 hypothetical protein [Candidatus Omnitrophota bacterium]MDD5549677.1 hypothetical protein [Candidatus Omnitrophota bacterium]